MLNLTEQLNTAEISSLTREGQPSKEQKYELNQRKHYLVLGLPPHVEQGVTAEAKKREKGYGKAKTQARTAYLANTRH